jgi:two-component system, OmpR family, sensor histidine kinase MprB
MRLRYQLAITMSLLALVVSAAMGMLSYTATRNEAIAAVDNFLDRRVGRFDAPAPSGFPVFPGLEGDSVAADQEDARRLGAPVVDDDSIVTVIDEGGATILSSNPDVPLPVPLLDSTDPEFSTITVDGERYRLRAQAVPGGPIILNARSLAETDSTLAAVRGRLTVIGAVITMLGAALGWLVAGRLARPLRRLSGAAHHVAVTGDLDTELDTTASGEVGDVASSFATMLDALQRSRNQQQQLIVDAGHEIKTPLTTLRANADLLAAGKLSPEHQARALARISSEVDELAKLTSELLELARDTPDEEPMSQVDIVELAHVAAERAAERYERPVTVVGEPFVVVGRASSLDRAVTNLLGNAAKFSEPGTPITVNLSDVARIGSTVDGSRGSILVSDHGAGISETDRNHVFERFYRSPEARTLPGSGLGLAIVAATAEEHGGGAFVAPSDDGASVGFTFLVSPESDEPPTLL